MEGDGGLAVVSLEGMRVLVSALRVGRALPNPTGAKWYSLALAGLTTAIMLAMSVLVARGWMEQPLSVADAAELAAALLASFASGASGILHAASSERVGLLPSEGP